MARNLKRRKVEDGEYEILDRATGEVVATVWESGNKWYRWRVSPKDGSGGWDTNSISDAVATLSRS
jgi:hypothetical protein